MRVVHLGVSGLGSGAHFLANGRVARFLLEELGFDALIFESGIYDLWRTERALREGRPAREAFQLGLWPFLADSKQLAPLSNYLAERIRGNRPISIAGFDFQFTSGSGAATFGTDLGEFLRQLDVSTPLSDADSPEGQLLRRWLESRLESGTPPPSPPELARLQEALTETAHRVEAVATKDERLWSQMLRSTAAFVEGFDGREEQMSDNLTWLVEEHFQDRRVVVFGTNYHMIRDRALLPHEYWAGPWPFTTGERLAEVLGSAVYQIGATSYEGSDRSATPFGRRNDIQADLSPYPEFEEWMAATGIDYGIVDLRGAAARGEWAGGIFVARPLGHVPMRSTWSRHLDAILFVREQRPSEQVERPAG